MFVVAANAQSQTRFYLFRTITSPFSPTVNGGWTVTSPNPYSVMMPNKAYGVAVASASNTSTTGGVSPRKIINITYISQPLIAQTISSGSIISGQWRTFMSNVASQSGQGWVYIRLLNQDGTVNSEIGSMSSTNLATGNLNRTYTLTLGSNVVVADFQRIEIETGWNYLTGSVITTTGSIISQVIVTASDLPVDNTTNTATNPWLEFSQTLKFVKGILL